MSAGTAKHAACAACVALGIALGIGGSAWRPWGFAPAPESLQELEPAPGRLLMSADGVDAAIVPAGTVRQFGPPAQAVGIALFVRGSSNGRSSVYADCAATRLLLIGGRRSTWQPSGPGIGDKIAAALCMAHPLLRDLAPEVEA